MSVTMPRKAAEFWWNFPLEGSEREPFVCPPDVAYFEKDKFDIKWKAVTWKDIHKKRTEKIRRNLEYKRRSREEKIKPCIVWVIYVDSWLMGGYYTIIKTLNKEWYLNFRGEGLSMFVKKEDLKIQVMEAFPLCFPMVELFDDWMALFAKRHSNHNFYRYRKIQGTAFGWCKLDKGGNLMAISADKKTLINEYETEN